MKAAALALLLVGCAGSSPASLGISGASAGASAAGTSGGGASGSSSSSTGATGSTGGTSGTDQPAPNLHGYHQLADWFCSYSILAVDVFNDGGPGSFNVLVRGRDEYAQNSQPLDLAQLGPYTIAAGASLHIQATIQQPTANTRWGFFGIFAETPQANGSPYADAGWLGYVPESSHCP